jgi:hypothetical protein
MTLNIYKVQDKLSNGKAVTVQFNSRATGRRSGETYLIGGIVNLGNVLVKRLGDAGIGGVMIPIDELNEVK